jgi:GT2 family glycosyltransferase
MKMTISVVIATFNRAAQLAKCLAELRRQGFTPGDDVIVADNGSTDDTRAVLDRAAAGLPVPLRVVHEAQPGKSVAVRRAVLESHADVLALTDDDVLVGRDWIRTIRDVMAEPGVALAGGPVLPSYAARVPDWLDLGDDLVGIGRMGAPLGLLDYGLGRGRLGPRIVLGANLAVRRDAFLAVGGYQPDLGKRRGTLLSGEDHDLCERIQAAGHLALYEPSMRVSHIVPADRLKLTYFVRWFFWSGLTHAALERTRPESPTGRRLLGLPAFAVKDLAVASLQAAGSAVRAAWPTAAEQATRLAFDAGYLWASARPPGGRPDWRRRAEAA